MNSSQKDFDRTTRFTRQQAVRSGIGAALLILLVAGMGGCYALTDFVYPDLKSFTADKTITVAMIGPANYADFAGETVQVNNEYPPITDTRISEEVSNLRFHYYANSGWKTVSKKDQYDYIVHFAIENERPSGVSIWAKILLGIPWLASLGSIPIFPMEEGFIGKATIYKNGSHDPISSVPTTFVAKGAYGWLAPIMKYHVSVAPIEETILADLQAVRYAKEKKMMLAAGKPVRLGKQKAEKPEDPDKVLLDEIDELENQGRFRDAAELTGKLIEYYKQHAGEKDRRLGYAYIRLASLNRQLGQNAKVTPWLDSGIGISALTPQESKVDMVFASVVRGIYDRDLANFPAAKASFDKALQDASGLGASERERWQALIQTHTAISEWNQGQLARAEELIAPPIAFADRSGIKECNWGLPYDVKGELLLARSRFDDAEKQFQKAIDICKEGDGAAHPLMGRYLAHQAVSNIKRGRFETAKPLLDQALKIRLEALGENHAYVASNYSDSGLLAHMQTNYQQALASYDRALTIDRAVLPATHPDIADVLNRKARLLADMGDYAQAGELARAADGLTRGTLDIRHPLAASVTLTLGIVDQKMGRFVDAESRFKSVIELRAQVLGQDTLETAEAYRMLANLYREWGNLAEAQRLLELAKGITARVFGEQSAPVALALVEIAKVERESGDLTKARATLDQAAQIQTKTAGAESTEMAETITEIAKVDVERGNYQEARVGLLKAIMMFIKSLGESNPRVADAHIDLAAVNVMEGNISEARKNIDKAVEIQEQTQGKNNITVFETAKMQARVLQNKGEEKKAEQLFEQVVQSAQAKFGENSVPAAKAEADLGKMLVDTYQFDKAGRPLEKALEAREKTAPDAHYELADTAKNLARLYEATGRLDDAEKMYEKSLAENRKAFGDQNAEVARAYKELAMLYASRGDLKKAEAGLAAALDLSRRQKTPDGKLHPDIAKNAAGLAMVHIEAGRLDQAAPLFDEALKVNREFFGNEHPVFAKSLDDQGLLFQAQGKTPEAEKNFIRAVEIYAKTLYPEHPDAIAARSHLAVLYWSQDKKENAKASFDAAFAGLKKHILKNLEAGLLKEGLKFLALHTPEIHRQISFSLAAGDAQGAYERAVFLKGLYFDAAMSSSQAEKLSADPEVKALFYRLRRAVNAQSNIYNAKLRFNDPLVLTELEKNLKAWDADIAEADRAISQKSNAHLRNREALAVSPKEAMGVLPAGSALLDIVRYRVFTPEKAGLGRFSEERYAPFLVERSGILTAPSAGAEAIDKGVEAIAGDMEPMKVFSLLRNPQDGQRVENEIRSAGAPLYNGFLKPFEEKLKGVSIVLVSPDGPLAAVPFEILADDQGHYLVTRYVFGYEASIREIMRLKEGPPAAFKGPSFLLGDADFGTGKTTAPAAGTISVAQTETCSARAVLSFGPLPETAEEVKKIAGASKNASVILTGATADEGSVKKKTPGNSLIYYSTHGYVIPRDCGIVTSATSVRGGGFSSANIISGRPLAYVVENPLNLCGLALAGANVVAEKETGEDGLLTGIEVAAMDLAGTDAVVLSACQTGLGYHKENQGLVGLRYAFTLAGSRLVAGSAWSVPSDETKDLMEDWVPRLISGAEPAKSMQKAKLDEIEKVKTKYSFTHPFFWGAFTVSGKVW